MRLSMTLKTGDTFNVDVQIVKVKKGKATVIKIGDEEYVLRHKDQFKGGKRNAKNK